MGTRLFFLSALLWGLGCKDNLDVKIIDTQLSVLNRTQFEILSLQVHDGELPSNKDDNLLSEPLAIETSVIVPFSTSQYVTIIRKKVEVGDTVAITTAEGLDAVDGEGYTLIVFDESFRLMEPGSEF